MIHKANPVSKKIVALSICTILTIYLTPFTLAQSTTILNAQASSNQPQVDSTLTVALQISNVENLAGIDATLQWNPSVLTITKLTLNLGDSYINGVLHGSQINYDPDALSVGDIFVNETIEAGSYNILAQSIGQSTPGFTGSGTIVTLSFIVKTTGAAGLSLQTELTNHPLEGQTADKISHQDTADSVTAVPLGSQSSPTSTPTPPTSTPTTSTSPSTPQSSNASTTPTPKPSDNNSQAIYWVAAVELMIISIAVYAIFIFRKRKTQKPP